MGLINYHTHTPLCGHASGTIEEYIQAAISRNFSELGFSDHAPLPDGLREGVTMAREDLESYLDDIVKFSDMYREKISIKLGLEVDYPLRDSFDKKYFHDPRIDFLMGSCHFIGSWPFDQEPYKEEFKNRDVDEAYASYYSIVESLVESSLFDIIGHFDLIKKFGYRPGRSFAPEIEQISKKMARRGIASEINTSGLLKPAAEIYPSDEIINIFFKNNVPLTIGSDCHSPETIDYMLKHTVEKLKKAGYKKISGFSKRKRYDIDIQQI